MRHTRLKEAIGRGLAAPASLQVAAGEIVGVFGLVGAGRSELMNLVYGGEPRTGGRVEVDGAAVSSGSPADAISKGLVFCPEDRKKEGIFPVLSVGENVNISARRSHAAAGFFVRGGWERANAQEFVKKLGVRTPSIAQAIVNLSGGNQQKVILARWMSSGAKILIFDEPTRGIDVGAKAEVFAVMSRLVSEGASILMISSELNELIGMVDRVLVMRGGRLSAELPREEISQQNLLRYAS